MDTTTWKAQFSELKEQSEANPNIEARATTVLHRICKMYREALTAGDLTAIKGITDELGRQEIPLGQSIAAPVKQIKAGAGKETARGAA